ncbi:DUF2057 family protein [Marinobacter sp. X15-166B]|uniref:DUF2057 family protein n=1 Tax=Marinobacter sp. X15-166B TaxID=1897620 RepID=UPI00085BC284|nr:DUF2057 family protein [Marinobacter sp. X15-166B]OEY66641.1 hypothetical protein BG841_09365 [Marinobacter sp. X15-166B]
MRGFRMTGRISTMVRAAALTWVALVVAGCSSQLSRVQTWDGAAVDPARVAVLKAPAEIKVKEVNGKRVGNFLMDDLVLDYELLPGDNQIVFTYKTIWAKGGVVKNGESKVHVVETAPQQVTLVAQPGAMYRFEVPSPKNRQAAEAVIADFSGRVVDQSGATVATAQPHEARTEVARDQGRVTPAQSADNALDTLEGLKVLWQKASAEEKREFLTWAFE